MRRIILKNSQSPGDIVMLTAAVRDLHKCCPGQFETDVRTSCPDLWLNNQWVTELDSQDAEVESIDCHYPLIHRSNQEPWHFIHGFIQDLSKKLEVSIHPTHFGGDLHLSKREQEFPDDLLADVPEETPWWIIGAGGKYDFTIKWWSRRRYQEVVDRLEGRVHFVQVGQKGHYHPALRGVTDLRGRTSLRDLVRLTYHAHGVLCGVTLLMHLAAANAIFPFAPEGGGCRGGREGADALGGLPKPSVSAYCWNVAMLLRRRVLAIADGCPR